MKLVGKYIIEFSIDLGNGISVLYEDLKDFTLGEDYDCLSNAIIYGSDISIDDYYGVKRKYVPILKYLVSMGVLTEYGRPYEKSYIVVDKDKLKRERGILRDFVAEILNNYKSYERDFNINNIITKE